MAGVKGKSGRPSNANEALRLRVLDKAWVILEKALDDPDIDPMEKREIARSLAVKSIPQHLEGDFNHTVVEMAMIQKSSGELDGQPVNRIAEFDIGSLDSSKNT